MSSLGFGLSSVMSKSWTIEPGATVQSRAVPGVAKLIPVYPAAAKERGEPSGEVSRYACTTRPITKSEVPASDSQSTSSSRSRCRRWAVHVARSCMHGSVPKTKEAFSAAAAASAGAHASPSQLQSSRASHSDRFVTSAKVSGQSRSHAGTRALVGSRCVGPLSAVPLAVATDAAHDGCDSGSPTAQRSHRCRWSLV